MALIVPKNTDPSPIEKWDRYDADTEVLVRGLDDDLYQIGLARARRQISKADAKFKTGEVGVDDGEITEHAYQCKLLSRYIIKGWRGAKDADGKEVKYTPEIGEATLRADINFFLFVIKSSGEVAAEAEKERTETAKKSSSATDGKSSETD